MWFELCENGYPGEISGLARATCPFGLQRSVQPRPAFAKRFLEAEVRLGLTAWISVPQPHFWCVPIRGHESAGPSGLPWRGGASCPVPTPPLLHPSLPAGAAREAT